MDEEPKEEELEQIERELLEEAEKKAKRPMPVSGKSVFEIKKIKDQDTREQSH